ncbi:MAG: hypothetical protein ACK5KT_09260 [Dysgonomonas sp.]
MKNNTITSWLFTPFKYIAGLKALIVGLIVMLVLSILGYLSNTHFDGALDIHYGCLKTTTPYIIHITYQLIGWLCLTIVFYTTAQIVSKSSVRLIDIAGTMALSQAPLIFAALAGFIPSFHICLGDFDSQNITAMIDILKDNIITLGILSIVTIVLSIWSILLMYNAYSISANVKGVIGISTFILALIIAEILSIISLYLTIPILS